MNHPNEICQPPLPICHPPSPVSQIIHPVNSPSTHAHQNSPKPTTLYISSSMFSGFNSSKLSSLSQNAVVLFYRGATIAQILGKLKQDPDFNKLDPSLISKIYVLCGTNNIDKILGIPFSHCSSFINLDSVQCNQELLNQACSSINDIYQFLHAWSYNAKINFVNIRPRISRSRNVTINLRTRRGA